MKTFDEAMDLLVVSAESERDAEKQAATMMDNIDRRIGLLDDVAQNPKLHDYIQRYIQDAGPKLEWSVCSLAISCFVNGVMIGMEMERQELPSEPPAAGRGSNQKGNHDEE